MFLKQKLIKSIDFDELNMEIFQLVLTRANFVFKTKDSN